MNEAVEQMLARYNVQDPLSLDRALREIIQEIALVGLWRAKFFTKAAFYGGTALRILYGLDRFSEDLDFTLLKPDGAFSWEAYHKALVDELTSYGFEVSFTTKTKELQSAVYSAFLKANAYREMLKIGVGQSGLKGLHPDTSLRIKVEIDTDPLVEYEVEQRFLEVPLYANISVVTLQHLFAAKLHCAFFRAWKNRVKGRDWYDMVWFIRKKVPLSLKLFSAHMQKETPLTIEEFFRLGQERIDNLAVDKALADIEPFVRDKAILSDWSPDFFRHWLKQITFL
jgi:predicted nucleotidyltransferase component of viral defense system